MWINRSNRCAPGSGTPEERVFDGRPGRYGPGLEVSRSVGGAWCGSAVHWSKYGGRARSRPGWSTSSDADAHDPVGFAAAGPGAGRQDARRPLTLPEDAVREQRVDVIPTAEPIAEPLNEDRRGGVNPTRRVRRWAALVLEQHHSAEPGRARQRRRLRRRIHLDDDPLPPPTQAPRTPSLKIPVPPDDAVATRSDWQARLMRAECAACGGS